MFFIPVICFLGGLMAMGRTKPKTAVHKIVALGPRSGIVYEVEDFREIGTVVVRLGDRACAQFIRLAVHERGKPGLAWQHGFGDPTLLAAIKADFAVDPPKPKAVKHAEQSAEPAEGKS